MFRSSTRLLLPSQCSQMPCRGRWLNRGGRSAVPTVPSLRSSPKWILYGLNVSTRPGPNRGRPWSAEEVALGFVGDVGDLMKLVQAAEGVRTIPDARAKLGHELADCLWSVMVLARLYDVDLEANFLSLMNELEASLTQRAASSQAE